mmetsp:Transcript_17471/g.39475  ORF Transcript_17471/g.39475 Transcript_17471/m.39475 type:complete len:260 (+) Transcript_17471:59-838(+)
MTGLLERRSHRMSECLHPLTLAGARGKIAGPRVRTRPAKRRKTRRRFARRMAVTPAKSLSWLRTRPTTRVRSRCWGTAGRRRPLSGRGKKKPARSPWRATRIARTTCTRPMRRSTSRGSPRRRRGPALAPPGRLTKMRSHLLGASRAKRCWGGLWRASELKCRRSGVSRGSGRRWSRARNASKCRPSSTRTRRRTRPTKRRPRRSSGGSSTRKTLARCTSSGSSTWDSSSRGWGRTSSSSTSTRLTRFTTLSGCKSTQS